MAPGCEGAATIGPWPEPQVLGLLSLYGGIPLDRTGAPVCSLPSPPLWVLIKKPCRGAKGQSQTGKWVQKLLTRGSAMLVLFTWTTAAPWHSHPEPARGAPIGLCDLAARTPT